MEHDITLDLNIDDLDQEIHDLNEEIKTLEALNRKILVAQKRKKLDELIEKKNSYVKNNIVRAPNLNHFEEMIDSRNIVESMILHDRELQDDLNHTRHIEENFNILPCEEVLITQKKCMRLIGSVEQGIGLLGLSSVNELNKFEDKCVSEIRNPLTPTTRTAILKSQLVEVEKIRANLNHIKTENDKLKECLQIALSDLNMTKEQLHQKLQNPVLSENFKSLKIIIIVIDHVAKKIPYELNEEEIRQTLKKFNIEDIEKLPEEILLIKQDMQLYENTGFAKEAQIEKEKVTLLESILKQVENLNLISRDSKKILRLPDPYEEIPDEIPNSSVRQIPNIEDVNQFENNSNKFEEPQKKIEGPPSQNLIDLEEKKQLALKQEKEKKIEDLRKKLEVLESELDIIPECAEKSLLTMSFYLKKIILDGYQDFPIQEEFLKMKSYLAREGLLNYDINEIMGYVELELIRKDWESTSTHLESLHTYLRPINIPELRMYIRNLDRAALKIKDKDIILFLGQTGTGKSTTIHFIAGSKLRKTEKYGLSHIEPYEVTNPDLKIITTSPSSVSETLYITAVEVSCDNGNFFLCDSPGFGDTRGYEIDIANGLGIFKAIRECRSVKPVIVISEKSVGERCKGLKDIAYLLTKMIGNLSGELLSFSFLFTKYQESERPYLHSQFLDIKKNLTDDEKSDKGFVAFFDYLIQSTKEGAVFIDPLSGNGSRLMRTLVTSKTITYPSRIFKFSIAERTRSALENQILRHQLSIIASLKRQDFDLILYKLDELSFLIEKLSESFIQTIYDECVQEIQSQLKRDFENSTSIFEKCLVNNNLLDENDINNFKSCLEKLNNARKMNRHLGEKFFESITYNENLMKSVDLMCDNVDELEVHNPLLRHILDKLKLLADSFEFVQNKYDLILGVLETKVEKIIEKFPGLLREHNVEDVALLIINFAVIKENLKQHFKNTNIELQQKKLTRKYLDYLSKLTQTSLKVLERYENMSDEKDIEITFIVLEKTIRSEIKKVIEIQHIEELQKILEKGVLKVFEDIKNKINQSLLGGSELSREESLKEIETLVNIMLRLRKIPKIETFTSNIYYSSTDLVVTFVRKMREDIEKMIPLLLRNEVVNTKLLCNYILSIRNATWLENVKPGVNTIVISSIEESLSDHIEKLQKTMTKMKLTHLSHIPEVYKIYSQVHSMEPLEKVIPLIKSSIEGISKVMLERSQTVLNKITNEYQEPELEYFDFKKAASDFNLLNELENQDCQLVLYLPEYSQAIDAIFGVIEKFKIYLYKNTENIYKEIIYSDESCSYHDLMANAQKFNDYLGILSEIQKHPVLLDTFFKEKKYTAWKSTLKQYQRTIRREMEESLTRRDANNLIIKINICAALSLIDDIMDKGSKFLQMQLDFQSEMNKEAPSTFNHIMSAISNNNFKLVFQEIDNFRNSTIPAFLNYYPKIINALESQLRLLTKQTTSLAINLSQIFNIETVTSIADNLLLIQEALKNFSDYIEDLSFLELCYSQVCNRLSSKIESCIDDTVFLINKYNFHDSNINRDELYKFIQISERFLKEEMIEKYNTLHQIYDQKLVEVEETYKVLDVNDYFTFKPRNVKFEMDNIGTISNQSHDIIAKNINNSILTKFKEKIEYVESITEEYKREVETKKLETVINLCPKEIHHEMLHEVLNMSERIKMKSDMESNNIKDAIARGDIQKIQTIYMEKKSNPMHPVINEIKNFLVERIKYYKEEFEREIRCDISRALNICENYFWLYVNFSEHFNYLFPQLVFKYLVTNEFEKLLNTMNRYFDNELCQFDDSLSLEIDLISLQSDNELNFSGHIGGSGPQGSRNNFMYQTETPRNRNITQELQKGCLEAYDRAMIFHQIRLNLESREIEIKEYFLKEVLPDNFDNRFTETHKKIFNIFDNKYSLLVSALTNLEIDKIISNLRAYRVLKPVQQSMLKYREFYNVFPFIDEMLDKRTYEKIIDTVHSSLQYLFAEFESLEFYVNDVNTFKSSYESHYSNLNDKYQILYKLKKNFPIFINKFDEVKSLVILKIQSLMEKTKVEFDNLMKKEDINPNDCRLFNNLYLNLSCFNEKFPFMKDEVNEFLSLLAVNLHEHIKKLSQCIDQVQECSDMAEILIKIQNIGDCFLYEKQYTKEIIEEILEKQKRIRGASILVALGVLLNKNSNGASILSENKCFSFYEKSIFKTKTQRFGIDDVLSNLGGGNVSVKRKQMKKLYEEFDKIYQDLIKKYLDIKMDLEPLISNIINIAGKNFYYNNEVHLSYNEITKIPKLVAHIFALWTLHNASDYFALGAGEENKKYLLTPHPAQVVSIFCMLGLEKNEEFLQNNLVEIKTGEGKSITLAVTSSVLALLGMEVSCACYSQYLSKRDEEAFNFIFVALQIDQFIHYDTFSRLCERIINRDGDIRENVENVIRKGINSTKRKESNSIRPQVLIIDEVDVFFSKDFYGNLYTPSICLRDEAITKLIDLVWNKKSSASFDVLKESPEFLNVVKKFPDWESIFVEALKDMITDIKNYNSHTYEVKEGKIGYKDFDTILFNILFGYNTVFAYYHENEAGKINKEAFEKVLGIHIKCGGFSYELITNEFKFIFGVTGTLQTLNDSEKSIIRNTYKIFNETYMPSVFKDYSLDAIERRIIEPMIFIEESEFNQMLYEHIQVKLNAGRPVLVFFEDKNLIRNFSSSTFGKLMHDKTRILTEEASSLEKDNLIKLSTKQGQVTLLTKIFGRGTDFVCRDDSILERGGVHVIQTFYSQELSEEVQIKGRTARQGENGSYEMICSYQSLEKFRIAKEEIIKIMPYEYEKYLDNKRKEFVNLKFNRNNVNVQISRKKHEIGLQIKQSLFSKDLKNLIKLLTNENIGAPILVSSRTICLFDATNSMHQLLEKTKETIGTMFHRAHEILSDKNCNANFELQFVAYRNYNSDKDEILEISAWSSKPDELCTFLKGITIKGGWGNEAIEVALWHVNQMSKEAVTQVLLIGDAAANTKDEIKNKRKELGENYWKKTKFATPTFYEEEINKLNPELSNKKIPIHTFFLKDGAKDCFQNIATKTGGYCKKLDIYSPNGSEELTGLVTEQILRNIGSFAGRGEELAQEYAKRFGKSYSNN